MVNNITIKHLNKTNMREIIIKYLLKGFKKRHVFITIDKFLDDGSVNVTVNRNINDKDLKRFVNDVIDKLPKTL